MENNAYSIANSDAPLIEEGVFLSYHTSFKIGGVARFFIEAKSIEDIKKAVDFAHSHHLDFFVLGGGSNTVFSDKEFDGVIIKNCIKGIEIIKEDEEGAEVKVFAGEYFDDVVEFCVSRNFCGIENLTAIPGTVGGAIVQNIGAYGTEIKNTVISVDIFNTQTQIIETIDLNDLHFGYRDSIFKKDSHKNAIIISVRLKLLKGRPSNLIYKDLKNYFEGRDETQVSISEVREALQVIRSKKFPDLSLFGTAGSFFKNCIMNQDQFHELQKNFPDAPYFDAGKGLVKLPSGWILDKVCGLKGFREGNLGLYEHQSLVVVNFGSATNEELKKFISKIKEEVFKKTKIILEEEVIVL